MLSFFNQITEWADKFTIWVALITLLFSFFNWRNNKKGNDNIQIELCCAAQKIHLSQTIKRRHCTRSEVQGVLANAYNPANANDRYKIPFLSSIEFFKRLELVQNNQSAKLQIDIDCADEFNCFNGD